MNQIQNLNQEDNIAGTIPDKVYDMGFLCALFLFGHLQE
jgi:hypothetical protein